MGVFRKFSGLLEPSTWLINPMANAEHLTRLKAGVTVWNEWFESHPEVRPELQGVTLIGVDLSQINLIGADLSEATLIEVNFKAANLRGATLRGARLTGAKLRAATLIGADLRETDLLGATLSQAALIGATLVNANLQQARLLGADLSRAVLGQANLQRVDLSEANLMEADLRGVDLTGALLVSANLMGTHLSQANLTGANLKMAQALGADLTGAMLTGACLQDWNINDQTRLQGVVCEYVQMVEGLWDADTETWRYPDRRPHVGFFRPGEFSALFQKTLARLDVIFVEGIDWDACFQMLQVLQAQYGPEALGILAIEKRGGGVLVLRLAIPAEADPEAVEQEAQRLYAQALKRLEEQYGNELLLKEGDMAAYRCQHSQLWQVVRMLAQQTQRIYREGNADE